MHLGRVVGCVWSTVKDRHLEGMRLLLVQPVTPELRDTGRRLVCTDTTSAGAGELVYWARAREAIWAFAPAEPPTDATIVGIVDTVHVQGAAEAPSPRHAKAPAQPKPRKRKASPC